MSEQRLMTQDEHMRIERWVLIARPRGVTGWYYVDAYDSPVEAATVRARLITERNEDCVLLQTFGGAPSNHVTPMRSAQGAPS